MMTKERLAELRVRATNMLARNSGAWLYEPESDVLLLIDAVEALQAELAEERAKRESLQSDAESWRTLKRYMSLTDLLQGYWAERDRAEAAEDIANLAMRVGLEMVSEESVARGYARDAWSRTATERDAAIRRAENAERELRVEQGRHNDTRNAGVRRENLLANTCTRLEEERDDLRARLAACVAALEKANEALSRIVGQTPYPSDANEIATTARNESTWALAAAKGCAT